MLKELQNRPRPGEAQLHNQLDELNVSTQALEIENLARAYQDGKQKDYLGAEKSDVREAIGRRQSGFALQLARTALADGEVQESEKQAIEDMADQRYDLYGACADLPRLAYNEARDLQAFGQAPNDEIRHWMLEQGKSQEVGMPAVRQLAELFFADGTLSPQEVNFALTTQRVFGTPVESEAQMYLRGLGCTRLDRGDESRISMVDEARSKDYAMVPSQCDWGPIPATSHLDALEEAVAFTLAHLSKG
jgi:uncharacterized tellurite resistance protein B-like protein